MDSAILQRPLYLNMIYGPVKSGKSSELVTIISSLLKGGHVDENKIEVFKHPSSDKEYKNVIRSKSGNEYPATEAETAEEIFNKIKKNPDSKYIFLGGINFYEDKNIVKLVEALRDSHRFVIMEGLNLNGEGEPYNHMGDLMCLAQYNVKKTAISPKSGKTADMSIKKGKEYIPISREEFFGFDDGKKPSITAIVGPMYSSKTETLLDEIAKLELTEKAHPNDSFYQHAIFKSNIDTRYKEGEITSHNLRSAPCQIIGSGKELEEFIKAMNPQKKRIVVDEAQFVEGIGDVVDKYYREGYSFIITALKRDYRGEPFNSDIGKILCLADDIIDRRCSCSHPGCDNIATETQRFIHQDGAKIASSYDEPQVQQGAKEAYTSRCSDHHVVRGKDEHNPFSDLKNLIV
jgi:thymidine kinase